jgi:hypothetical protein
VDRKTFPALGKVHFGTPLKPQQMLGFFVRIVEKFRNNFSTL